MPLRRATSVAPRSNRYRRFIASILGVTAIIAAISPHAFADPTPVLPSPEEIIAEAQALAGLAVTTAQAAVTELTSHITVSLSATGTLSATTICATATTAADQMPITINVALATVGGGVAEPSGLEPIGPLYTNGSQPGETSISKCSPSTDFSGSNATGGVALGAAATAEWLEVDPFFNQPTLATVAKPCYGELVWVNESPTIDQTDCAQ